MGLELYNEKDSDLIPMHDLKGGQIAIIENARNPEYDGSIVTRSRGNGDGETGFIAIGMRNTYDERASEGFSYDCSLLVRVLPPGTLLKIT